MRFLDTKTHGYIDYIAGSAIAASPWLFRFNKGGAETWIPLIIGGSGVVYSLLTNYELGAAKKIPMRTHLMFDLVSGLLMASSPWLLGFRKRSWQPHVLLGLFEAGASLVTKSEPRFSTNGHTQKAIVAH
ncbi:MAG: hypothetical protein V4717_00245 [Bacteroidota bacterium]